MGETNFLQFQKPSPQTQKKLLKEIIQSEQNENQIEKVTIPEEFEFRSPVPNFEFEFLSPVPNFELPPAKPEYVPVVKGEEKNRSKIMGDFDLQIANSNDTKTQNYQIDKDKNENINQNKDISEVKCANPQNNTDKRENPQKNTKSSQGQPEFPKKVEESNKSHDDNTPKSESESKSEKSDSPPQIIKVSDFGEITLSQKENQSNSEFMDFGNQFFTDKTFKNFEVLIKSIQTNQEHNKKRSEEIKGKMITKRDCKNMIGKLKYIESKKDDLKLDESYENGSENLSKIDKDLEESHSNFKTEYINTKTIQIEISNITNLSKKNKIFGQN